MLMTDKHIIDKDNNEVRKVEDARPKRWADLTPEEMRARYAASSNPHLPLDAYVQLALSSPDNAPVIETPRVVRSKFGAWRLDYDASEGKTTIEHDSYVAEFNVSTEDIADLARVLPALLAKVVE